MTKVITTDFGEYHFLDEHTVLAIAYQGVNIDSDKIRRGMNIIENEFAGDYCMILDRRNDYSVVPVDVYPYLIGLKRLRAVAIADARKRSSLPEGMEQRLSGKEMKKFTSIEDAHNWLKTFFLILPI